MTTVSDPGSRRMPDRSGRWTPPSPGVTALVAVVLAAQVAATVHGPSRLYVLGASLLLLDVTGTVSAVRAARRGDASAWLLVAAGRVFSLVATVALAVAAGGDRVSWWIGAL